MYAKTKQTLKQIKNPDKYMFAKVTFYRKNIDSLNVYKFC